jgi:hypothetical protein
MPPFPDTLSPTQIMHKVGPNLKRNQLRRVVIKFHKLWMRRNSVKAEQVALRRKNTSGPAILPQTFIDYVIKWDDSRVEINFDASDHKSRR